MKVAPLLIVTALVAGCTPAGPANEQTRRSVTPTIRVTEVHDGSRFKMPRGADLEVGLDRSDDPGRAWKVSALPSNLVETGHELQPRDKADPNGGKTEVYRFETRGTGHGRLELQDMAAGDTTPSRTFAIEIDSD